MKVFKVLSGGAAEGLITSLASMFLEKTGWMIEGEYGAVGTMADKLRAGTEADAVVLTTAVLDGLAREELLRPGPFRNIGLVETAVAIRVGDPLPNIGSADSLRAACLAADAIFVPDTRASTAGIHIAKILTQLGIANDVSARLKEFPNGATAMRHLAASDAAHPIGCTQVTEILNTSGIHLVGPLPKGCDLATMYAAAIPKQATDVSIAQSFIDMLCADEHRDIRHRMGFVDA